MTDRPRLIAGNWKMNGTAAALAEVAAMAAADLPAGVGVVVCPPATLIDRVRVAVAGSRLVVGAQDVHAEPSGAFTGGISAAMLHDAGARVVIVGHSERRGGCGERDDDVRAKAEAVLAADMDVIVCVGETAGERDAGTTRGVVTAQLDGSLPAAAAARLAVAYEPVWAVGSGLTPTPAQIGGIHATIRTNLVARYGAAGAGVPILYGGSVKPNNAAAILAVAEVGGALVGGASLTAADFLAIVRAA